MGWWLVGVVGCGHGPDATHGGDATPPGDDSGTVPTAVGPPTGDTASPDDAETACTGGVDDDDDGLVDCDDPDCDSDADGWCDPIDACPDAPGSGLDLFGPRQVLSTTRGGGDLLAADLDRDGDQDVVGASWGGYGIVAWFNQGGG
ncbi:MAG: hypothetical protein ABMB14_32760, partial [Myxococcota bacterium]